MHSEIEAIKLSCMAYTDDPTDTGHESAEFNQGGATVRAYSEGRWKG